MVSLMTLPGGPAPWFGLDEETLRFLEVHPARAHLDPGQRLARSGRRGDALLGQRARAVLQPARPPSAGRTTRARSTPGSTRRPSLFEALDRRPYLWAIPGLSTPSDIVARLSANGFVDQGGGYDMILLRDPADTHLPGLPAQVTLEHWNCPDGAEPRARGPRPGPGHRRELPDSRKPPRRPGRRDRSDAPAASLPRVPASSRRRAGRDRRAVHVRRREPPLVHRHAARRSGAAATAG